MTTRLMLIRHGTTNRNEAFDAYADGKPEAWDRLAACSDDETLLSQRGLLQACHTGIAVARLFKPSCVLTSRSPRALATATQVFPGLGCIADDRLSELNLGHMRRYHDRQIADRFPDEWQHRLATDPYDYTPPGGESCRTKVGRDLNPLLAQVVRGHYGDRVAVVSHSLTIRCLKAVLTGSKYADVGRTPNCAVSLYSHLMPGSWGVVFENRIFYPEAFLREKDRVVTVGQ